MKKGVIACVLVIGVLLSWLPLSFPLQAAAKGEITLEAQPRTLTAYEGMRVEIALSLKNLPGAVACFDLQVESDIKRFTLKKVTPLGEITTGELHYNTVGSTTYLIYHDKEGGESPIRKDGDVIVLTYLVNEGAVAGQIPFSFQCSAIGDKKADNMGMASARCTVQVTLPPSGNARLAGLTPSTGRLVPAFSADCFSYSLEVGANVDKLTFRYKTAHPSATAKINRETLNGKGKSTRMIVTVTAADHTTQKYTITVLRRKDGNGSSVPEEPDTKTDDTTQITDVNQEQSMKNRAPLLPRATSLYWALGVVGLFLASPIIFHVFRGFFRKQEVNSGDFR